MKSGLLFGACSKCCEDDDIVCRDDCGWPRRIAVTISGIGDGFCWSSAAGGFPDDNRFFSASDPPPPPDPDDPPPEPFPEPEGPEDLPPEGGGGCAEPAGPKLRQVGTSVGAVGWFAQKFGELNGTWILEFDEQQSGNNPCSSPVWSGVVNPGPFSTNGVPTFGFDPDLWKCRPGDDILVTVGLQRIFSELEILFTGSDGTGAAAEVTAINPATGQITAVNLLDGGSGYAYFELIRVQPTVTASIASFSGSGASLSVTLAEDTGVGGAVWKIDELTLASAGSGYLDSDEVVFDPTDGEEQGPASAVIRLNREEPTLAIDQQFANGTGATFSIVLNQTEDSTGQDVWEIDEITVTDAGSGYGEFDFFAVDVIDGVGQQSAFFTLEILRAEPTVEATIPFSSGGSGAVLSVTLTETTDFSGRPAWEVTAVGVVDGGTGYEAFDFVSFSTPDGTQVSSAGASLNVSGGVITSVDVFAGGLYYLSTGQIESLVATGKGQYFKTDGSIKSVTLTSGGEFFKLVPGSNVIDDTPAVEVKSNTGYDAEITAVVNKDPNSENFGKVTQLVLDEGGENYIADGVQAWQLGWFISAGCLELTPLAGAFQTPTLIGVPTTSCGGFDLTLAALPNGRRVSVQECGNELLEREYAAVARFGMFPNGITDIPEGAAYALGSTFGNCISAVFVDFGDGPITCKIEPA
jgi:hypothetical protein